MDYPNKLCVISPHILTVPISFGLANKDRQAVYLRAFAALVVKRRPDGRFAISQFYRHDQVGDASVELLIEMCYLLGDGATTLAAFRISDLAASLVQVPKNSEHQVPGKVALMNLREAVMRQPIDAALLDADGGTITLKRAALVNDLRAEWDEPGAACNPSRLRIQLGDRAQSMWLAIARDRLPSNEMAQAHQDYLKWKEEQLID